MKREVEEKQMAELVALIANNPGKDAEGVPQHLRRYLRKLEREVGVIEWRDGWHIKAKLEGGQ